LRISAPLPAPRSNTIGLSTPYFFNSLYIHLIYYCLTWLINFVIASYAFGRLNSKYLLGSPKHNISRSMLNTILEIIFLAAFIELPRPYLGLSFLIYTNFQLLSVLLYKSSTTILSSYWSEVNVFGQSTIGEVNSTSFFKSGLYTLNWYIYYGCSESKHE
jgi:hypothetical protein